jgi:hypothetical protein
MTNSELNTAPIGHPTASRNVSHMGRKQTIRTIAQLEFFG